MMIKVKGSNPNAFGEISQGKDGTVVATLANEHGGKHTYSPA